jgi:hypothetical protein
MPRTRRETKEGTMPKQDKTAADLQAVVDKIDAWPEPYRSIGYQLHNTILAAGPKVKPRIWYGMPGYAASRSTPVLVFFRLDDGVMSLGISEKATVEQEPDTTLRPSAWFLEDIDGPTLEKVAGLVRTAFA